MNIVCDPRESDAVSRDRCPVSRASNEVVIARSRPLLSRYFRFLWNNIFITQTRADIAMMRRLCNSVISCELFVSFHSAYFVCIVAVKLNSRENQFALSPRHRFLSRHICSWLRLMNFFLCSARLRAKKSAEEEIQRLILWKKMVCDVFEQSRVFRSRENSPKFGIFRSLTNLSLTLI